MPTERWEPNRVEQRASDIVDAVDRIERYVAGKSRDEFLGNEELQDAVVRRLDVIGVAIKAIERLEDNLPENERLPQRCPDIEWHAAKGMRNRLNKEYGYVDPGTLWETIHASLPPLRAAIIAAYPLTFAERVPRVGLDVGNARSGSDDGQRQIG